MKYQNIYLITFLLLSILTSACSGEAPQMYSGFNIEMPEALDELNSDYVRVTGSVWSVDEDGETPLAPVSLSQDSTLNLRGQYVLPVAGVEEAESYQFNLKIYYQASAYTAASILSVAKTNKEQQNRVEINTDLTLCPELSLTPDASLVTDGTGQWLLLCEVSVIGAYSSTVALDVAEESVVCTGVDADGDGTPNLDEIDLSYNPYDGDYDGDCVVDGGDAFPKDPDEWLDTDGDGIGNNADTDKDGDGLINAEETVSGTDELDADTDDDDVLDGADNCPLDGSSNNQNDSDDDDIGDLCDDDADNDGLTNSDEEKRGTNPHDADSDDDHVNDGDEVENGTNPSDADSDDDGSNDDADAFPLDPTENTDTDSDGVGDNVDNCVANANANQSDVDGDGTGDACDGDADNDGLPDSLENKVSGLDANNRDSDGDGLIDNWGKVYPSNLNDGEVSDLCPTIAKTVDNEIEHDTDLDDDDFGDLCDLSDDFAADPSADEIHFDAIFVSNDGDDSNDGSVDNPVASLDVAGELAESVGKDVYVTGDYTLEETLELPDGVTFYGGFSSDFSSRDLTVSLSQITATTLDTLILIEDVDAGLNGFDIQNNYSTPDSPVAIEIIDATATLANNIILVTNTTHATTITAQDSVVTFIDNEIEVSGGANVGVGVELDGVTGSIVGNEISVADFTVSRTAINCVSSGATDITLLGNTFDVWEGFAVEEVSYVYVVDCNLDLAREHFEVPMDSSSTWDGFDADGTNSIDGLF